MKIPIAAQIEEAEQHRDGLRGLVGMAAQPPGTDVRTRLDRAESICLTLTFVQAYEADFRAFMAQRPPTINHIPKGKEDR